MSGIQCVNSRNKHSAFQFLCVILLDSASTAPGREEALHSEGPWRLRKTAHGWDMRDTQCVSCSFLLGLSSSVICMALGMGAHIGRMCDQLLSINLRKSLVVWHFLSLAWSSCWVASNLQWLALCLKSRSWWTEILVILYFSQSWMMLTSYMCIPTASSPVGEL